MAEINSLTYGDTIFGTDENDVIDASGMRSSILGAGGDDSINAARYLSTVYGGAGNDTLSAGRSYVKLFGDDGNDRLRVDTYRWNENIANVTLEGGAGADTFEFRIAPEKRVSSACITDFGTGKDSLMIVDNSLNDLYLSRSTNDDGDLVVDFRYNEVKLTFKGISNFDDIKEVSVGNGKYIKNIEEIPVGIERSDVTLSVHSEYEGALWLGGTDLINNKTVWGADSIVTLDASDDAIGGRMLGGNEQSNVIRANNYGSLLWGGDGGDDTLTGGNGADMFFTGKESGDDVITNCDENDLVILMDIDFDALTDIELTTDDGSIDIASDDSHIRIEKSNGARTTTVQLADNSKWQYTYSDRSWQFKP